MRGPGHGDWGHGGGGSGVGVVLGRVFQDATQFQSFPTTSGWRRWGVLILTLPFVLSHISCVWLFAILWTVASQAPLSMGFSRKEYCSRLPCPRVSSCPRVGHDWATELTDWLKSYFYWCQDYQNSKWNLSHSLRFHLSKKQFKDIFKKCTYAIHIHTPQ